LPRFAANPATATDGRRRIGGLSFFVFVVFVGRHWLFTALFPNAIVGRQFAERAGHFADVRGSRSATRADVIHAHVPGLQRVIGHLAAAELERFELVRKRGQAGEIAVSGGGAKRYGLRCNIGSGGFAHLGD